MALSRRELARALLKDFKDFESSASNWSSHSLKQRCDELTGFAYVAVKQLEDEGRADFLFLKHDNLRHWYQGYKDELVKREQANLARQRKAQLKEQALAKLTKEEREALGIKK